jgi:hypothetical protein
MLAWYWILAIVLGTLLVLGLLYYAVASFVVNPRNDHLSPPLSLDSEDELPGLERDAKRSHPWVAKWIIHSEYSKWAKTQNLQRRR